MNWKRLIHRIKNFDYFELGNSFCIYYLLVFGLLPLLKVVRFPYVAKFFEQWVDPDYFNFRVVAYLLVGFFAFVLGHHLFSDYFTLKDKKRFFADAWEHGRTLTVFIFVFLAGLAVKLVRIWGGVYFRLNTNHLFEKNPFYSLLGLLDCLSVFALAVAFAYYFHLLRTGDPHRYFWRIIAWGTFLIEITFGLLSGSRGSAIVPIVVYLVTKHYLYKKSFLRMAVAVALVVVVIMPLGNVFRDPLMVMRSYTSLRVEDNKAVESVDLSQFTVDSNVSRIDQSVVISKVFNKTRTFLYGRDFYKFFVSLGPPRFIWKSKPVISGDGNELGRRLGILEADDFQTQIGPTLVGDFYINFAFFGICVGMFLFGMFFRFLFNVLMKPPPFTLSGVVVYTVVWLHVIPGVEGWAIPTWAGFVKLTVILLVLNYFLVGDFKKLSFPILSLFKRVTKN
jgi:hypothetical protein